MQVINLLKFINSVKHLYALDFDQCNRSMVNILDSVQVDEQFTSSIDLGIFFVEEMAEGKFRIVDGLNRILSLSLLLHAVCECYKKTSDRNDKAIKTIRSKYLVTKNNLPKLHLNEADANLYTKIINGERLSGHEKNKPMFILLHDYWSKIKEQKLQASKIFKMLQKISIKIVNTNNISARDIFYNINSQNREIEQILLIEDLFKEYKIDKVWEEIKSAYFIKKDDINLFLHDFFITKFDFNNFNDKFLYNYTKNYFETMLQYQKPGILIENIKRAAMLYNNILNINFDNKEIRNAFINIKKHSGEDTYAYILNVYDDYYTGSISETIFIEILNTIDEYLKNRQSTGKTIDFNELIGYLNAFITCK